MTTIADPPPDGERRRSPHIPRYPKREGGPPPFIWPIKVRSYELDAIGHVSNPVYVNYLEGARAEAFASIGLTPQRCEDQRIHVVIAAAALRYLAPAHLHDELDVSVEVVQIGRTSATFHQKIQNRTTSRLAVDAEVVGVFMGPDGRPTPVPEEFIRAFGPPPEAA